MELSTLFIAVVFVIPFAMGLVLLGAMVVDALPAVTDTRKKTVKTPATRDRKPDDIGFYLPA
jgi:hypothetical protein